jgi:hypothetical protein
MRASGEAHWNWKGGRVRRGDGYQRVRAPQHPRATAEGYVYEHILIVERAIGRLLPVQAEVHHVDGDPSNNAPNNLVACEDHAYHFLLERRARAYEACGDANAIRCRYCGQYDRQSEIQGHNPERYRYGYHRSCGIADRKRRRTLTEVER